jgi:imidazole glycerol-phosphate synthase subunit HisH
MTAAPSAASTAVAVVDYGLANIQSVVNALECFAGEVRIASTGEQLEGADKIVLPGVGHFDEGMRGMRARGHDVALDRLVRGQGVPMLGICLGFQFLFARSEEGKEAGLGWVDGSVRRIAARPGLKIPHMGWSEVECPRPTRLFAHLKPPFEFYFVHSYAAENAGEAATIAAAVCDYGAPFVAALERDNIFATQFHPEKSQLAGMKLLETFLAL